MGFGGSESSNSSVAGSTDVALNNPINDNVLTYDSVTSKWKNALAQAGSTDSADITTVALPADDTTDIGPALQTLINSGTYKIILPYSPTGKFYLNTPIFWPTGGAFGRRVEIELNGNIIRLGPDLPHPDEFTPDAATTFAFYPNTRATALSGATVTCTGNAAAAGFSGQVLSLILSNGTFEVGTLNTGVVFANQSPVQLHNITLLGGKTALSYHEYTDGMQITGHAHFRSSSAAGLGPQPSGAYYYYQFQEGDGVFIESIKCDGAVSAISMTKCRGATIHGLVTAGVRLIDCEGIEFFSVHQESDIYTTSVPTNFTIQSSDVTFHGGTYYRPHPGSGLLGTVVINDTHTEKASSVKFISPVWATFHRSGYGDITELPHVWIESVNNGGSSSSNTELQVSGANSKFVSSGTDNQGTWKRGVGAVIAAHASLTTLAAALESTAGKAVMATGSFNVDRRGGAWRVQNQGFPGWQTRNNASQPSITAVVTNQANGGSLPNTSHTYAAAIRDTTGEYTQLSTVVSATPSASLGVVRLLIQASGPGVLVLWRKEGAGVDTAPDCYIELPFLGGRTWVLDTGVNVNLQPWLTATVPVPTAVTNGTNNTTNGLLIDGSVWPTP